jgi:hypothetical protein
MPDLSLTTEQLTRLAPVLAALAPLSPPPSANGRYAIIRATEKAESAIKPFATAEAEMMNRYAVPGSIKQVGSGRVTFDIAADKQVEYVTERTAMLAEPITLTGVRAITRAELGECPITIQQDRVLVECGLLEAIPDISP